MPFVRGQSGNHRHRQAFARRCLSRQSRLLQSPSTSLMHSIATAGNEKPGFGEDCRERGKCLGGNAEPDAAALAFVS
jgi:hypothetical protein